MNNEDITFKKRFKGVENFLRRVAFNLGNTPSQTEVKIISCIPIDVTDLQQKIVQLEKQLEQSNTKPTTSVQAAAVSAPKSRKSAGICCVGSDYANRSTTIPYEVSSLIFPRDEQDCRYLSTDILSTKEMSDLSSKMNACRKKIFKKRKTSPKLKKNQTHIVYYAQTDRNTPFTRHKVQVPSKSKKKYDETSSLTYINDVIRKQYERRSIKNDLANGSNISSPICRDIIKTCKRDNQHDSDLCSCCRGGFRNIDLCTTNVNSFTNELNYSNQYSYYDSNMYDMIPVKEKPVKKDVGHVRKLDRIDIRCWPGAICQKSRVHPTFYNHTVVIPQDNYQHQQRVHVKNNNAAISKKEPSQKACNNKAGQLKSKEFTNICAVGKVYTKENIYNKFQSVHQSVQSFPITASFRPTVNSTKCQTTDESFAHFSITDKTEATLNQIKSILQTVLTEVKINSMVKNDVTVKKDVFVQNDSSQSNMQESNLLNSFSFGPLNKNPYVAANYYQDNANNFSGSNSDPMKCYPYYPLLIHPAGRNVCNSCYKNSTAKTFNNKVNTKNVNTENNQQSHNQETEKLIKEIYKSMALNFDVPTQVITEQETCSTIPNNRNEIDYSEVNSKCTHVNIIVSEIFKNNNLPDSTNTTVDVSTLSNEISMRSRYVSTEKDLGNRRVRSQSLQNTESFETERSIESQKPINYYKPAVSDTSINSFSSSELQEVETAVPQSQTQIQKQNKKSLLSRMFKIFKTKGKMKKNYSKTPRRHENEEYDSSDSDYQTIYSLKNDTSKQKVYKRPKPHSKISYSRQIQRTRSPGRITRQPYMEQEYRRHWNEKMMFKERAKNSTDLSKSTRTLKPVYFQNYETKNAVRQQTRVPHKNPNPIENRNTKWNNSGIVWLKKCKGGIQCGNQWKKLILEG